MGGPIKTGMMRENSLPLSSSSTHPHTSVSENVCPYASEEAWLPDVPSRIKEIMTDVSQFDSTYEYEYGVLRIAVKDTGVTSTHYLTHI